MLGLFYVNTLNTGIKQHDKMSLFKVIYMTKCHYIIDSI